MTCQRLGCERQTRRAEPCCSSACKAVYNELEFANRLAEHLGHSDPVDSYVSAAEALNIALTAAHTRRAELQAMAVEVGWSVDDFQMLIRGELTVARPESDTTPPPHSETPTPISQPKIDQAVET